MIHCNFAWGYIYGIFFVFVAGLMILIENTVKKKQPVWMLAFEWAVYVWHLGCGIAFFAMLYMGGYFYV